MLILVSSANSQISPMLTQHCLSSQLLIGTQSNFALHILFLISFAFVAYRSKQRDFARDALCFLRLYDLKYACSFTPTLASAYTGCLVLAGNPRGALSYFRVKSEGRTRLFSRPAVQVMLTAATSVDDVSKLFAYADTHRYQIEDAALERMLGTSLTNPELAVLVFERLAGQPLEQLQEFNNHITKKALACLFTSFACKPEIYTHHVVPLVNIAIRSSLTDSHVFATAINVLVLAGCHTDARDLFLNSVCQKHIQPEVVAAFLPSYGTSASAIEEAYSFAQSFQSKAPNNVVVMNALLKLATNVREPMVDRILAWYSAAHVLPDQVCVFESQQLISLGVFVFQGHLHHCPRGAQGIHRSQL
jgi:hypothetical protein